MIERRCRGLRDGRAPRRTTVGQAAARGARLGADVSGQQISVSLSVAEGWGNFGWELGNIR